MHSAKKITYKNIALIILACTLQLCALSQENSPYSRYGLGDIAPNRNIFTRGMGGISAAIVDYNSANFTNPASLAFVPVTIFDVAAEGDWRTLKSKSPSKKFTSANALFSYLQMSFPLTTPKMYKKNMLWAASFGLKPLTKVNYKLAVSERLSTTDSAFTTMEGSGGLNQAFLSTAFKYKDFSIGLSTGYTFGKKYFSTRRAIINDTVPFYEAAISHTTSMGGLFANIGVQYYHNFNDNKSTAPKSLRLGAYANFGQKLKATQDEIIETLTYQLTGATTDSIKETTGIKGTVVIPANIGFGASFQNEHWLYGVDFETAQWANYRFYGASDVVQNSWTFRAGAQYYPAKVTTTVKNYFNFVKYRAGFYYGNDYIKSASGKNLTNYAFTLGAGMPMTTLKRISYTGEYVVLNTALEVGGRSNKAENIKESTIRFSVGLSMNARWFQKRKYD